MLHRGILALLLATVFAATTGFGAMRLGVGHKVGVETGSVAYAGLATAAFFAGRALAATLSSIVYDRYAGAARRLPPASLAGVAAVVYAIGLSEDPGLVSLLTCIQGMLSGMVWPYVQTLVALASGGSSLWVSVYFALGSLGVGLGRLAYPHIMAAYGLQAVFAYSAAAYTVSALLLTAALGHSEHRVLRSSWRGGGAAARAAIHPVLLNFTTGFANGLDAQVVYPILVLWKHIDVATTSYALSAASIASIPAKIAVGAAASRYGMKRVLVAVLAGCTIGLATLWLVSGPVAAAGAAVYLSLAASLTPLARTYAAVVGRSVGAPATIVGVSNTAANIGSIISPLLAAPLYTVNLGFIVYTLPALLATLAARTPRDEKG